MKILFVSYKRDYDNRWRRTSREYSASYFLWYVPLVKFAKERHHQIVPFWIDEVILGKGRVNANPELLRTVLREKPEIMILYGCEYDLDKTVLQKIKEQRGTTSLYFCGDDSWSFDSVSKHFAPYFHWIVTWHSGAVKRYHALGYQNVIGSQVWVDTESYRPTVDVKDVDVSFVGTWNRARGRIIDALRKSGIPVVVRGNGWPEGPVSQEEMLRLISRSKISLSLNSPAFYVGPRSLLRLFFRHAYLGEGGLPIKFDAHHFVRNLQSWFQKRMPQLKGRCFEIPACRTMEITQPADNLEEYYEPGKEILFYKDIPDLIEKIKSYLARDEEREGVARRGYERTIRNHTFEKRLDEVLSRIGGVKV